MDWQPIETAPKDGTQILVWDGIDQQVVEFHKFKDGTWCWEVAHMAGGHIFGLARIGTHWQSLPAPPTGEPPRGDT